MRHGGESPNDPVAEAQRGDKYRGRTELRSAALSQKSNSSEARLSARDQMVDLGIPNAAGDEQDAEFERY